MIPPRFEVSESPSLFDFSFRPAPREAATAVTPRTAAKATLKAKDSSFSVSLIPKAAVDEDDEDQTVGSNSFSWRLVNPTTGERQKKALVKLNRGGQVRQILTPAHINAMRIFSAHEEEEEEYERKKEEEEERRKREEEEKRRIEKEKVHKFRMERLEEIGRALKEQARNKAERLKRLQVEKEVERLERLRKEEQNERLEKWERQQEIERLEKLELQREQEEMKRREKLRLKQEIERLERLQRLRRLKKEEEEASMVHWSKVVFKDGKVAVKEDVPVIRPATNLK